MRFLSSFKKVISVQVILGLVLPLLLIPTYPKQAEAAVTTEASFMGEDYVTKGNWVGVYGGEGYILPFYSTTLAKGRDSVMPNHVVNLSSNIQLGAVNTASYYVNQNPSKNEAVLQSPDKAVRKDIEVYSYTSMKFSINVSDQEAHMISLYCYKNISTPAVQRIDITDPTGKVVHTREIDFRSSGYYTYSIKGSFTIVLSNISTTAGLNGIFIDKLGMDKPSQFNAQLSGEFKRSAQVKWAPTAAEDKVSVERKASNETQFQKVLVTDGTRGVYTDSNLNSNLTYTYRLRKIQKGIYSIPTNEISVKMPDYKPCKITMMDAGQLEAYLGAPIQSGLMVTDLQGKALEGIQVKYELEGNGVGTTIPKEAGNVVTDANGKAILNFKMAYGGSFVLKAIAQYNDEKEYAKTEAKTTLKIQDSRIGVPVIYYTSEAVRPGELITINGGDILKEGLEVLASKNDGVSPAEPPADAIKLQVVDTDVTGLYVVARLPKEAPAGMYDLWVKNFQGCSKPVKINAPRLLWVSEGETWEGLPVKLIGRNFNPKEYGVGESFMQVRLVNDHQEAYPVKLQEVNPFAVTFITKNIPTGIYSIELRTSKDGIWVKPGSEQRITVVDKGNDPLNLGVAWAGKFNWNHKINAKDFGAKGDGVNDDTVAVQNALNQAKKDGGGVVYVPAGSYLINQLQVPSTVVLMGEDKKNTFLICTGKGTDTFISQTREDSEIGKAGLANFTIQSKTKDNWEFRKFAVWFGHRWGGDTLKKVETRTAQDVFVINVDSDVFAKYRYTCRITAIIKQNFVLKDCISVLLLSTHVADYAHVIGNVFEYNAATVQIIGQYFLYENNHIVGYPEDGHEMHGLSTRSRVYAYNNVHERTGAVDMIYNDSESFLIEPPGAQYDTGDVLRADGVYVTLKSSRDLADFLNPGERRYKPLAVMIVGGRGAGQWRAVVDAKGNELKLDKPWGITPDSTSKYSLLIPSYEMTIYRNIVKDCGATFCLYGQVYDTVVAENKVVNSGGISNMVFSISSLARNNPNYYIRVDRNDLQDIQQGKRTVNNTSGVFYDGTGFFMDGPGALGIEYRENVVKGINNTDANAFNVNVRANAGQHDYLKNIIFSNNSIDRVKWGFGVSEGAAGVIIEENKVINASTFVGAGIDRAIKLGENGENGRGASWQALDESMFMEKAPFPASWESVENKNLAFSDIEGHWAKSEIMEMASKGIIKGLSDSEFGPEISITRAQWVALVARAIGQEPKSYRGTYRDVFADQWYSGDVQAAAYNGLLDINLTTNGYFNPVQPITREEMCSILMNAYTVATGKTAEKRDISAYEDRDKISDWTRASIEEAVTLGVITGISEKEFAPKEVATRAMGAVILKRFMDIIQSN